MSADAYEIPKSNIPIPERGTYIPSFYTQHQNLALPVLDEDDGMLGFAIGDVLPERRFAIKEDGHLLSQHQFEQRYKQWCERVLAPNGSIVEIKRYNKYFNVDLETVPGVDEFVDAKPDASMPTTKPGEMRYVPIAFDPLLGDNGRRKIRALYTHTGERAEPGQKIESLPPPGFDAVVPAKKAAAAKPKPPEAPLVTMPCGKDTKVAYQKNHARNCKACLALAQQAEGAAAEGEPSQSAA